MRENILQGDFAFPYFDLVEDCYGLTTALFFKRMWSALWANYVRDKSTINTTYWLEELGDPTVFNQVLIQLCEVGWIKSEATPERNWAEAILNEDKLLEYVTVEELADVRANKKHRIYMMKFEPSKTANLTKSKRIGIAPTGHERYGFAKSAATQFYYDTVYLNKYRQAIIDNCNKGMTEVRKRFPKILLDSASYDSVTTKIVESLSTNPELFTMGQNYSDSRGRSIKSALKHVANPIGYKDFRALITIADD